MAQRRRSSSGDGGAIAGFLGICFVIGLVITIVKFVIATWYIWTCLLALFVIWSIWQRSRPPLYVEVERSKDQVVFLIKRRVWAKPFPAEADSKGLAGVQDERTRTVRWFNPAKDDEELLAQYLSETQDKAAWWTYRMKGGKDDVDRAIVIANDLAKRNIATRKPGTPA
jgi:hypothetical protein